jgi:hypothetical protein
VVALSKKLAGMGVLDLAAFALGKLIRLAGRLGWRWRSQLTPFWTAVAVAASGSVLRLAWPTYWWIPITLGVLTAPPLYVYGPKLSQPLQRVVLAVVPSALDDGKKGVLDRDTERAYLSAVIVGITGWLSWLGQHGWDRPTWYTFLGCSAVSAAPWLWHRRIRRTINRYVRRHPVIAENVKGYESSRARILPDESARGVTVIAVQLAPGRGIDHVGARGLEVASAYGIRPGGVTISGDPKSARRVLHRVVPRDPWKARIPHPMPMIGSLSFADTPNQAIGILDDATEQTVNLLRMVGAVGKRGSGKSSLLESLLVWVSGYQQAVIVAADLASGATFGVWEEMFASPLATTPDDAFRQMQGLFALGEHRERKLNAAKRNNPGYGNNLAITDEDPVVYWFCDEFPELVKAGGKPVIQLATRIAAKFRKVHIVPVVAGQNPTEDDFGATEFRAAIESLFGLLLDQRQTMTLWGEDRKRGWDSTNLSIGQHLLRDDEHQVPRIAKGFYVSPEQRAQRMRGIKRLLDTSPWGQLPAESVAVLTGHQPAVPVSAGAKRVSQPRTLEVVRDEPADEWRQSVEETAERVWNALPERGDSGRKVQYLAEDLTCSRHQVNRALAFLKRESRVWQPRFSEWTRA